MSSPSQAVHRVEFHSANTHVLPTYTGVSYSVAPYLLAVLTGLLISFAFVWAR
jgi:hypothetical protein